MILSRLVIPALVATQLVIWPSSGMSDSELRLNQSDLLDQDDYPFLFFGQQMSPGHPRWEQYASSLTKFPEARHCLLQSGLRDTLWDMTAVDWGAVGSHKELEVCLFRLFASLGTPERVVHWLDATGYYEVLTLTRTRVGDAGSEYVIEAFIDRKSFEDRVNYPSTFSRLLFPAKGYMVQATFDDEGALLHVFSGNQGR